MKQMTSTSNIQLYTDIQLTLYVNGINELRLLDGAYKNLPRWNLLLHFICTFSETTQTYIQ